ncbi:MAG TPA: nucleotidyltransferase family protein [Candidatus Binataceae bacterium]|nr:nucleotidyltransferase family protein [Candidatus Binataceae bacterium]
MKAVLRPNSPEAELLLDCCRPTPASDGAGFSAKPLDFEQLASLAQRHGVLPQLARRLLARTESDKSDNIALSRIFRAADAIALRCQYLIEQLASVLAQFTQAGIETLLVKGPVIGALVYGDPSLRPFGDLDLVVHPRQVPIAAEALIRLGFCSSPFDQEAFASGFFDAVEGNFQRSEDRVNIDLHWDLMPRAFPFGPSGEAIWGHSRTIDLNGISVRTLSNEDHLLYMATHTARHGWEFLSQVCDIAYYLKDVPIDWSLLLERASTTHSVRILAIALVLARELLSAPIPAAGEEFLRDHDEVQAVAHQIREDLIAGRHPKATTRLWRILSLIDRPADRLRYLAHSAFAPTLMDRHAIRLPRWAYPAYFLVRPPRLAFSLTRQRR